MTLASLGRILFLLGCFFLLSCGKNKKDNLFLLFPFLISQNSSSVASPNSTGETTNSTGETSGNSGANSSNSSTANSNSGVTSTAETANTLGSWSSQAYVKAPIGDISDQFG